VRIRRAAKRHRGLRRTLHVALVVRVDVVSLQVVGSSIRFGLTNRVLPVQFSETTIELLLKSRRKVVAYFQFHPSNKNSDYLPAATTRQQRDNATRSFILASSKRSD
jgi:hypothetical protein